MTEPKDNSQICYTDIHLDGFLEGSSFYAIIDGKELDVFVTKDTTSDKTILSLEYLLPADKIIITNQPDTLQSTMSNSIPDWVKSTAGWWANGDVDDNTFVQSIQFLVENGIISLI